VSGAVNATDWLTEIQFKEGYTAAVAGHQVKVHATSLAWA
jgi:hypothetical protein